MSGIDQGFQELAFQNKVNKSLLMNSHPYPPRRPGAPPHHVKLERKSFKLTLCFRFPAWIGCQYSTRARSVCGARCHGQDQVTCRFVDPGYVRFLSTWKSSSWLLVFSSEVKKRTPGLHNGMRSSLDLTACPPSSPRNLIEHLHCVNWCANFVQTVRI